jgi:hypothetical protein
MIFLLSEINVICIALYLTPKSSTVLHNMKFMYEIPMNQKASYEKHKIYKLALLLKYLLLRILKIKLYIFVNNF